MAAKHNRGKLSRQEKRTLARVALFLVVAAILWLLFAPGHGLRHYRSLMKKVRTLTEEKRILEKQNAELEEEIHRLQTDDRYLEELARRKYGLLKEDESVYIFDGGRKKKK